MTKTRPWLFQSAPALPDREEIATDRIARLRSRIADGAYTVQPQLIAEAILACEEGDDTCGDVRAIQLTSAMDGASND